MRAKPNKPVYNRIMECAIASQNLIRADTLDQEAAGTLSAAWQQRGRRFTTPSEAPK